MGWGWGGYGGGGHEVEGEGWGRCWGHFLLCVGFPFAGLTRKCPDGYGQHLLKWFAEPEVAGWYQFHSLIENSSLSPLACVTRMTRELTDKTK